MFTVSDNGVGMKPEELEQINGILAGEIPAGRPAVFWLDERAETGQLIFGKSTA